MAHDGSKERDRKKKNLVHIDKLIDGYVQGSRHAYAHARAHTHMQDTDYEHTHPPTRTRVHAHADRLKRRTLTSLPSLDAAQREDVLLIGEELPHLVEGLLPSNG